MSKKVVKYQKKIKNLNKRVVKDILLILEIQLHLVLHL